MLGAAIAVADGLVWAELGAAFPRAGGSYAFLREIYGPDRAGNWLSFLFVWQLSFTAPLSIASGCIGLSSFLAVFWPGLESAPIAALPALHYANFAAAAACLLVTALLYRNLSSITRLAWVLFAGVIAALTGVIVSGFAHAAATGGWHMPAAPALPAALALGGLAQATLISTYDYWGYYNITFLGSEVRHPERTIPRAILLSVAFVSAFYILMNLAALPSLRSAASHAAGSAALRVQLVADIARSAFGRWAGYTIAALIVWTAFASVFSLLLGYSRVPYAAARDGNYFRFLAAVHPKHGIPHRSLVALGLVGAASASSRSRKSSPCSSSRASCCNFSCNRSASSFSASAGPTSRAPSACRSTRCRPSPPWQASPSSSSTALTQSANSPLPPPSLLPVLCSI